MTSVNAIRIGSYYRSKILQTSKSLKSVERVIDIGSHDGYLLSFFPDSLKIAVDVLLPVEHIDCPFVIADAKALPFKDGSFDLALLMDVIEHIEDETGLSDSLARIIDKEGGLFLTTPSVNISLFPKFLTKAISKKWGHHFRLGYTKDKLKLIFQDNFSIEIEDWNAPFFRLFYLPLRLMNMVSSKIAFFFLDRVALYDALHKNGLQGYLLLTGKLKK